MFLKKTPVPSLKLQHLYVGASVVVMARTLKVTALADEFTRSRLTAQRERCGAHRAACPRPAPPAEAPRARAAARLCW
jgi:hypothetical protein